jgi:hypothetical protein
MCLASQLEHGLSGTTNMMSQEPATDVGAWVVLVTDGALVSYPPEIYRSLPRASLEAERWAWLLSGEGRVEVGRPFGDRWTVGERDIRLVGVGPFGELTSPWVGTYWTRHGAPDPEAVILSGEFDARAWVREPPSDGLKEPRIFDTKWSSAAIYVVQGEEEYAVAHLAKVVA